MAFKFNPLTGELDMVGTSAAPAPSTITIAKVVHSLLLDKDENSPPTHPYITIVFDEDSILFNDDEAL